jgi:hypothetical protein
MEQPETQQRACPHTDWTHYMLLLIDILLGEAALQRGIDEPVIHKLNQMIHSLEDLKSDFNRKYG